MKDFDFETTNCAIS